MTTYMLTWKDGEKDRNGWVWDDLPSLLEKLSNGQEAIRSWSCGNTKKIRPGDRVFMMKQGSEPAGLIASGRVVKGSYQADHYIESERIKGKKCWKIDVKFDYLVDARDRVIIPRSELFDRFPGQNWNSPSSGIEIKVSYSDALKTEWAARMAAFTSRKTYSEEIGMAQKAAEAEGAFEPDSIEDARKKTLAAIVRRQGQQAFRKSLLEAYRGKCAISGCNSVFTLEAAHIYPYKGAHTNQVSNGLLLRADIHTLFDLGLIAIDPARHTVVIAGDLKGTEYDTFADKKIRLPSREDQQPDKAALYWHLKSSKAGREEA